ILGPFPLSLRNNKYIFVATEYFTRYAIIRAFPDSTSIMAATFIVENIICQFGTPKEILSDRGVQFRSQMMNEVYYLLHIRHITTTSFHAQCNGLTERFNHTLAMMISMYLSTSQNDWDRCLHFLAFAYNSAVQSSTGFSPFYLTFGREPVTPIEVLFDKPSDGLQDEHASLLAEHISKIRLIAKQNLINSQEKSKVHYDKKRRHVEYDTGEKVLVYFPIRKVGKSEKLLHKWLGPFKIVNRLSPLVYEIENVTGKKKRDTVNVTRLKKFHERNSLSDSSKTEVYFKTDNLQLSNKATCNTNVSDSKHTTDQTIATTSNADYRSHKCDTSDSDESNTEDNKTILRRSKRITAKPDRLIYYYMFIMIMFQFGLATFPESKPVLWKSTHTPVITGTKAVYIAIKYTTPCDVFDEKFFSDRNITFGFQYWCENMMLKSFYLPLNKFCVAKAESVHVARAKREIVLGTLLLGFIIVSCIATISLSAFSLYSTAKTNIKVEEIDKAMLQRITEIESLRSNDEKIKNILHELTSRVQQIDERITELTSQIDEFTHFLPKVTQVTANIAARLINVEYKLYETARMWKKNKISPLFFDIFNITLPCDDHCPIEFTVPISCEIDSFERIMKLKLRSHFVDKSSVLMKSDAFNMVSIKNEFLCFNKYIGPNKVIFNKYANCIFAMFDDRDGDNNLILSSITSDCVNVTDVLSDKQWIEYKCMERDLVNERDIVQIKQTDTRVSVRPQRNPNHTEISELEHIYEIPRPVNLERNRPL
ncbi:integrase core domain protein-like protein, partial [Leptotrombidium deliense]